MTAHPIERARGLHSPARPTIRRPAWTWSLDELLARPATPTPTRDREHIGDALHADARLDVVLARYAEHGRAADLAQALSLSGEVSRALREEARRIRRLDLVERAGRDA